MRTTIVEHLPRNGGNKEEAQGGDQHRTQAVLALARRADGDPSLRDQGGEGRVIWTAAGQPIPKRLALISTVIASPK